MRLKKKKKKTCSDKKKAPLSESQVVWLQIHTDETWTFVPDRKKRLPPVFFNLSFIVEQVCVLQLMWNPRLEPSLTMDTHKRTHPHTHRHMHACKRARGEPITGKEWVEKCILNGWDDAARRFMGPISCFSLWGTRFIHTNSATCTLHSAVCFSRDLGLKPLL